MRYHNAMLATRTATKLTSPLGAARTCSTYTPVNILKHVFKVSLFIDVGN